MAFYEHVFLVRPEVSRPQVDQLIEQLTKVIQDNSGQVTKQEYWGLRALAYPISKNTKAHYALLNIDASSTAVAEMERQMRFNESILRFLTTRVETLEDGPSSMIQSKAREDRYNKNRRDDRDGGGRDNHREGRDNHRDNREGRDNHRDNREGRDSREGRDNRDATAQEEVA